MRWTARRVLARRKPYSLLASLAAAAGCATVLTIPADGGSAGVAQGLDPPYQMQGISTSQAFAGISATGVAQQLDPAYGTGTSTTGQAFGGVAAVGALFYNNGGKLGGHYCTASVVHSRAGDLAVTAAHCVPSGMLSQIAFVPGYADGKMPFGVWQVTKVFTDQAWQASQDPDDDVAFLQLSAANDGVPIEDITGAEQFSTAQPGPAQLATTLVQVIGYPDGQSEPVWCVNWTKNFGQSQLEFDCGGYTDGTSGGPFLADVSTASGQGVVIGVIGGFEQGGLTPSVSYASKFGTSVAALYETADADG